MLLVVMAMLGLMAFFCAMPGLGLYASALGRGTEAIDEANVEFRRAIIAVREAEAVGASEDRLRILVEKLNSALWMIDRADGLLLQGDVAGASAQAERGIEISRKIVSDAVKLRDESIQSTHYGRIFTFGLVPVASLLVTAGAHFGWKWWRRREIDRTMRMEIRGAKEPEEES